MKLAFKTKKQLKNELEAAKNNFKNIEWVAKEWRNLFDSITDFVSLHDKDFRIVRVNKALADYIGVKPVELIGKRCYEVFHTLQTPIMDCPHIEAIKSNKTVTKEYYEPKIGLHLRVTASPAVDEKGNLQGSVHIVKNITEHKQAEKYLRLTQFTVDRAADAVFWIGPDARFLYVNEKACYVLGYSREELLSMSVQDIDTNFPIEAWPEHWEAVKRKGSLTVESCYRTKDNKIFPVEINVNYLEFDGKEYNCAFARNITERKKAEDALQESEKRYREVVEGTEDLIASVDKHGRFIYVNHMAAIIFGIDSDKCIGKSAFRFIHPVDKQNTEEWFMKCAQKKSPRSRIETRHVNQKTGKVYHMLWTCNFYYDKEGEVKRVNGIASDITDRKIVEDNLRAAAITDDLTGLLNRRGFFTLADHQCKLAARKKRKMALVYIDMDNLKKINDELGHETGDQALEDTAKIFKDTFRESDIIARIGGDEFTVLLTESTDIPAVDIIINHLQESINNHNQQGTRNYKLSITTGIAIYDPQYLCSIGNLLSQADKAMYNSKKLKT